VVDDLERADAEVGVPPLQRGVQVVDPVADVVQALHHRPSVDGRVIALLTALEAAAGDEDVQWFGDGHDDLLLDVATASAAAPDQPVEE